jgi:hypothetical protein
MNHIPNIIVLARTLGDFPTLREFGEFLARREDRPATVAFYGPAPIRRRIEDDRSTVNILTGSRASTIVYTYDDGSTRTVEFPTVIPPTTRRMGIDVPAGLTQAQTAEVVRCVALALGEDDVEDRVLMDGSIRVETPHGPAFFFPSTTR